MSLNISESALVSKMIINSRGVCADKRNGMCKLLDYFAFSWKLNLQSAPGGFGV